MGRHDNGSDRSQSPAKHSKSSRKEKKSHKDKSEHKSKRDKDRAHDKERSIKGSKDRYRDRDRRDRDAEDDHPRESRKKGSRRDRSEAEEKKDRKGDDGHKSRDKQDKTSPDSSTGPERKRSKSEAAADAPGGSSAQAKQPEAAAIAVDPEAEIEKRRARVKAWQDARKREAEAAAAKAGVAEQDAKAAEGDGEGDGAKGWSLEDEDEDDAANGNNTTTAAEGTAEANGSAKQDQKDAEGAAAAVPAGSEENASGKGITMKFLHIKKKDEDDDVFSCVLSGGKKAKAAKPAPKMKQEVEVDPLDAFMSDFVMPQAQKEIDKAKQQAAEIEEKAVTVKPKREEAIEDAIPMEGVEGTAVDNSHVDVNGDGTAVEAKSAAPPPAAKPKRKRTKTRYETSSDEESEDDEDEDQEMDDEGWAKNVMSGKMSKADKLAQIDHSQIDYPSFRKNFYIEVGELKRMTAKEVEELRSSLDGVKARGKNPPKPIKKFTQCGLSSRVLEIIKRSGFETPMPIQAQALPVIMSGRDCIGVAKTGSGKTLAFVLPMLRHIKDQPPLAQGDGPISMVMAPTRELVQQIGKEVKKFAKAALITVVTVFGGSGVANQISDLKRGTEVVVCTPGRMIDILATSNGKITNLRRITYLVLDEADRMFDMGFEPQIMRIIQGIRPDRQTVLFSATFPRSVESLARQALDDPVEVQVGGRSIVNSDISQYVEIRPEEERFLRLLEILGEWYEKGKIIVFVQSQDKCDVLFRDLLKSGYPCLSLHGGKEQTDRESTISDFKSNVCNILIATSVAARGLDVKDLVLVLNYDPPNHHEDYVHRVGRTGRAGAKGTAITFLGPDDDRFAPDVVKALKESKQEIPADLQQMCNAFTKKKDAGLVQAHGSGFGGSGFKFDSSEDDQAKARRKQLAAEYKQGDDDDDDDAAADDDDDDVRIAGTGPKPEVAAAQAAAAAAAAAAGVSGAVVASDGSTAPEGVSPHVLAAQQVAAQITAQAAAARASGGIQLTVGAQAEQSSALAVAQPGGMGASNALVAAAQAVANQLANQVGLPSQAAQASSAARAQAFAAQLSAQHQQGQGSSGPHYEAELEINDFPQHSRWKVTHKDALSQITEMTGAAITTRGQFFRPGTAAPAGERKLFLLIEGPTELSVKRAKQEVKRILEETTEKVMRRDAPAGPGRYNV